MSISLRWNARRSARDSRSRSLVCRSRSAARTDANDPYRDGLPAGKQTELAQRYADVFALFAKNRARLTRVTFWGVTDARSWLNNFPVRGRVNHPLLWDREGKPKRAFGAVAAALNAKP